jgi:hypothetical protein
MGNLSAASRQLGPSSYPEQGPEPEERAGTSRITPVMPIPDWLREQEQSENRHPTPEPESDETEHGFWNAPPRYSVAGPSLMPATPLPSPPRWRVWSARLLFSAILCAVVGLLGVEASSLDRGALAARAPIGLGK